MGRFGRSTALAAGLVLAATLARGELFRRGPQVLEAAPLSTGAVAFAAWDEVRQGRWPEPFLAAVRGALGSGGGVLLVGSTDAVGPRALNDSLGLQYAVHAAGKLAAALSREPWRFACASAGEDPSGPSGVRALPWTPAPASALAPSPVLVLDPASHLPRGAWLWSLWRDGGSPALWSVGGALGADTWAVGPGARQALVPLPARAETVAVGAHYAGAAPAVRAVQPSPARQDPALALSVEAVDTWWARLRPAVPSGYGEVRVWSAGIPYPVVVRSGRAADVSVVLLPGENRVYLQAVDPRGQVVAGPVVELPRPEGDFPAEVVVLVWDGEGVDLDLHGWSGPGHTHPQDPDPAFSARAAAGARLLFDGDSEGRASALASWSQGKLELEVWCYSDLSGAGARAWVYRIEKPGDRLDERRTCLGPRRLSRDPLEARWPLPLVGELAPAL